MKIYTACKKCRNAEMIREKNYFEKMAKFRVPEKDRHYDNAYPQMCHISGQIRSIAKNSLKGIESHGREKISDLLKKFQELNTQKVFSLEK